MQEKKSKRGGDVKKAPPGFYTAKQAQQRLRMKRSEFNWLVKQNKIERTTPPNRHDGYYDKSKIDRMADENALFTLNHLPETVKYKRTDFAQATEEDLQGIYNVIVSLDWPATSVDTRRSWYTVNNQIDYVVKYHDFVLGYINLVPYGPDTMEAMLSGRKRGWNIKPHDILPFEPGKEYDCFIGIAMHKEVENPEYYARHLIIGFLRALIDLAKQGIYIHHLYATSDQHDGVKIANELGFVRLPAKEGDLFGRFMLDLYTANTPIPKRYQKAIKGIL